MARTTSNEDRHVVTKGSDHEAYATEPDVCRPPGGSPQPFPNWVNSSKLKKGETVITFIDGESIWTSIGELGPLSEPAHAGTAGGVVSGTYRFEARPTSFSRDLFFEGNAAVRAFDTTTQNHGNTIGLVIPSELADELRALMEECLKNASASGAPFIAAR
ncbi:MAG TPA: PAAR-like domain-containing protein [Polyangiaceae bacterium]|jgi:uncharacterized protein DUF4150|nr:PAAR-like domain-containing protein [Polyangiaceae bacterium]